MECEFDDEPNDDEEIEPATETPAPPDDPKFSLTVTLGEHKLKEQIVRTVSDRLVDRFEKIHRERIERAVDRRAQETVAKEVDDAVRRVIAEGWEELDRWGGRGKRVSLAERVAGLLREKVDNYGNNRSRYESLMRDAVEEAFKRELAPMLEQAKAEFKAALDDGIRQRLADALKGALGLR